MDKSDQEQLKSVIIKYDVDFMLTLNSKVLDLPVNIVSALRNFHLTKGDNPTKPKANKKIQKTGQKTRIVNSNSTEKDVEQIVSVKPKSVEPKQQAVASKVEVTAKVQEKRVPFATIKPNKAPLQKSTQPTQIPISNNRILNENKLQTINNAKVLLASMNPLTNKENLVNVVKKVPTAVEKHQVTTTVVIPPIPISQVQIHTPSVAPVINKEETKEQKKKNGVETDPHRLDQRQKQIDFGYNSEGYRRYLAEVPKSERIAKNPMHPITPRKTQQCSKRSWDGQVRKWRRGLHQWDPQQIVESLENHEMTSCDLITSEVENDYYQFPNTVMSFDNGLTV